ncbi:MULTISPECIES: AAA family ATPase [unclassified Leifsonia]|uniref:AAA family ATPase n=1 Tax=unclassified Leifsonia TaxID=2663824 RepID=UPI0009EA1EF3|nr:MULTISPECIES: ParA family protein [unclassified Leifsonia]
MAAIVLMLDRAVEDALLADVIEHGHSVVARAASARELLPILDGLQFDVLVASAAGITSELLAVCDRRGVRVIAIAANDGARRHAADVGLLEVLDADAGWDDVENMLGHRGPPPVGLPEPLVDRGVSGVIAVWGPTGAPGRTTLAVNVAAEIAARGYSVLLADIDPYGGTVAPMLGLLDEAPGFAAACRLAGADSLTRAELDRIAQRYGNRDSSFRVLTGISRATRWPELGGSRVTAVLDACRRWVDVVVIDTGFSLESDEEISSDLFAPRRNGATIAALRAADHVIAVGGADPIALPRFLRGYADLTEAIEPIRVSVVMNRLRASASGVGAAGHVLSTLRRFGGIEGADIVPDDRRGVDAAVLAGATLREVSRRSPARLAIERFVEDRVLPTPDAAPRRTRWRTRSASAATSAAPSIAGSGPASGR